LKKLVMKN